MCHVRADVVRLMRRQRRPPEREYAAVLVCEPGGSVKVLVTGDRGYIGVVLVPFLRAAGHQVDGLDLGLCEGCDLGLRRMPTSDRRSTCATRTRPRWPTMTHVNGARISALALIP